MSCGPLAAGQASISASVCQTPSLAGLPLPCQAISTLLAENGEQGMVMQASRGTPHRSPMTPFPVDEFPLHRHLSEAVSEAATEMSRSEQLSGEGKDASRRTSCAGSRCALDLSDLRAQVRRCQAVCSQQFAPHRLAFLPRAVAAVLMVGFCPPAQMAMSAASLMPAIPTC